MTEVIDLRDMDRHEEKHSFECPICVAKGIARIDLMCKRKHIELVKWETVRPF